MFIYSLLASVIMDVLGTIAGYITGAHPAAASRKKRGGTCHHSERSRPSELLSVMLQGVVGLLVPKAL